MVGSEVKKLCLKTSSTPEDSAVGHLTSLAT